MDNISKFEEYGRVSISKEENFAAFLSELEPEIKAICPDYELGEFPSSPHKVLDTALQHRLDDYDLLPDQVVHGNPLFGKRIITQAHDLPKKLIPLLEHPHILNHVSSILGTSEIVLINGSIHGSYPGSSENDMQYHSDTANFTNPRKALSCVSKNKFVLNVQVFLDDVDGQIAPTKMLLGTHKPESHLAINSLVSKHLGLPDNQCNLVQSNWIYEELFEGFNLSPVYVTGERGGISLMNSSLLHGASKNVTSDRVRRVAILNYARKSDHFFGRIYPYQKSKLFYQSIDHPRPIFDIYKKSSQPYVHILGRVDKFFSKIQKLLTRNFNRIIKPYYSIQRLLRIGEKTLNKFVKVNKEYLNIGAGPVWQHERFVTIDQCFETDEALGRINVDLVKDLPLPFEDDSFKGIYSSHCFEHLTEAEITKILGEAYRVLEIGGTIRVVVPDMESMFDAYDRRDGTYADWFRAKQGRPGHNWFKDSWLRLHTRSFAGHVVDKFDDEQLYEIYKNNNREDFITSILNTAESNPSYLNVPNAHKSFWSSDKFVKKFQELGFKNCLSVKKGVTRDKVFSNGVVFDNTLPGKSIIVEGNK
jgi:predicted SAM-dependent methyltransferase